jgi:tetratricopeptide (TPR) repeat protein
MLRVTWVLLGLLVVAPFVPVEGAIAQQQVEEGRSAEATAALAKAEQLNEQVLQFYREGKYQTAIPLAEAVLQLYEKYLGRNHPAVATSLNNLAELYRAQGRYGEAEPLFHRSLKIQESALGNNHPAIASSLNNPSSPQICVKRTHQYFYHS